VIGPVVFVAAWAIAGATTSGYSNVDGAISDLAAVGAPTQVAVTASFVVFGIGMIAFGLALRDVLAGHAWIAAIVTGACTIGVAATPLHGWSGDEVHGTFAVLGYTAVVGVPLLAAAPLAAVDRPVWARVSVVVAVISAVCLVATASGSAHGLWQRLGLTVADAWIVVTAAYLVTRPTATPTGAG